MKKPILRPILVLSSLLFVMFYFQNCGQAKKDAQLTVQFPGGLPSGKVSLVTPDDARSQAPTESFDIWNGNVAVQSLSAQDFNCFGITIGGGSAGQAQRCEDTFGSPLNFGRSLMGQAPGQEATIAALAAGDSITINVLAWRADDAEACESLKAGTAVQGSKLSRPLLVGQRTVTLQAGDQAINIDGSVSNGTELIGCSIFTAEQSQQNVTFIGGQISGVGSLSPENLLLNVFRDEGQGEPSPVTIDSIVLGSNGPWSFNNLPEVGEEFFISTNGNCNISSPEGSFRIFEGQTINDFTVDCSIGMSFNVSGLSNLSFPNIDLRAELIDAATGSPIESSNRQVSQDGRNSFFFESNLDSSMSYQVTYQGGSHGEGASVDCVVENGSGSVGNSDIEDIEVVCTDGGFQQ